VKHSIWAVIALAILGYCFEANATLIFVARVYQEAEYTVSHESYAIQTDFDSGTYEEWGVTMYRNISYCYYELHNDTRPGDSGVFASPAESPSTSMTGTGMFDADMCWHMNIHRNFSHLFVKYLGTGEWQIAASTEGTYSEFAP
jgi:hypothetical protein